MASKASIFCSAVRIAEQRGNAEAKAGIIADTLERAERRAIIPEGTDAANPRQEEAFLLMDGSIAVRDMENDRYEYLAGGHRLRAAKNALGMTGPEFGP